MFSGLYGNLPQAKDEGKQADEGKKEGWAGSGLLAPAKRPAMSPPPSVLRASGRGRGREGPPPVTLSGRGGRGRGPATAAAAAAAAEGVPTVGAGPSDGPITVTATAAPSTSHGLGAHIQHEYDPARPNDYEAVRRQREQQRKEAEEEAARQERLKEEQDRLREMRQLEELELQRGGGAASEAQQPPRAEAPSHQPQPRVDEAARRAALSLSGEEAFRRRAMLSGQPPQQAQQAGGGGLGAPSGGGWGGGGGGGGGLGALSSGGWGGGGGGLGAGGDAWGGGEGGGLGLGAPGAPAAGAGSGAPKGLTLAQKMLEKMGWKEGEGLGRDRQGMTTPLMMQKTDVRSGVIVSGAPTAAQQAAAMEVAAAQQPRTVQLSGTPSRVVLLTNMVGPGEADEGLDAEVGEECNTKYGPVTSVLVFEVTQHGFPATEAVRIFVQFERVESATKACIDLSGRFFGGRMVNASFFDEERFEKQELAPRPGEVHIPPPDPAVEAAAAAAAAIAARLAAQGPR